MANVSEHRIKIVKCNKPKMLIGLNQNGKRTGTGANLSPVMGVASPVEKMGLKRNKSEARNTVSPMSSRWVVRSQGLTMGQWVEDDGKSERHPVMGWIGVEPQGDIIPRNKRADFHLGLLSQENLKNLYRKESK